MASPARERQQAGGPLRVAVVALASMLLLQSARVLFPLLFDLGERQGTTGAAVRAAGLALVVFLAPLLAPALRAALGPRGALLASLAGLGAARVVLQLDHPVSLWLAAAATAIGLVALTLLLAAMRGKEDPGGGRRAVLGLLIGMAFDTAIRSSFSTWDFAWQEGTGPLVLAVASSVALLVLSLVGDASRLAPRAEATLGHVLPLALIGLFLWLQVQFLQNVAFVASAANLSVPVASAFVLLGDAFAVAALAPASNRPRSLLGLVAAGAGLVAASFLLRRVEGASVVLLVLIAQSAAAPLLAAALSRPIERTLQTMWRTSVAFGVGSVLFVVLLVGYQIHYRVPLSFPNTFLAPAAAVLIAVGGVRLRQPAFDTSRSAAVALAASLALLLVPLVGAAAQPRLRTVAGNGETFRFLSYNVHLAIGAHGQLDPEAIARTIARGNADVVALQEVPRGWVGAGTIDLAAWLSRELRMPFLFAPAADGQFGNAILSRLRIVRSSWAALPLVEGAQARSYLRADIDIGKGTMVTVVDVHLEGNQPDHRLQVRSLLKSTRGVHHTVIAGDMNMQPKDRDRRLFDGAGLVSAQDATGNGDLATATDPSFPGDRPDWIYGSLDVLFSDFRIEPSEASDHLPLSVTVTVA